MTITATTTTGVLRVQKEYFDKHKRHQQIQMSNKHNKQQTTKGVLRVHPGRPARLRQAVPPGLPLYYSML